MRRIFAVGLVAGLLVAGTRLAQAQGLPQIPNPYVERQPVSPYVNLLRRDAAPGVLYLGEIRPQFQFRRQLQAQQQALGRLQSGQQSLAGRTSALESTGHPTYFQSYGGYYSFGGRGRLGSGGFPSP